MPRSAHPGIVYALGALASGLIAVSCSGGGSTNGGGNLGKFQLTSMSVPEGAIWQVNRPIEFSFSEELDFSSVGPNTITIQSTTGIPANGVYSIKRLDNDGDGVKETTVPNVVVFQPTCPTRPDKSDSGLSIGAVRYVVTVLGRSSGAQDTVRSAKGVRLEQSQSRSFVTPVSPESTTAFLDPVPGPPQPVIRDLGSSRTEGVSYFEIGGNPDDRVFFEFDENTQDFSLSEPDFESPLNLYSDPTTKIAAVVIFDQPVSPEDTNINSSFLGMEILDSNGVWQAFDTRVTLIANCTEAGATVRIEPIGILPVNLPPPDALENLRVTVNPGFRDLTGQEDNPQPLNRFAVAPTRTLEFTSLTPMETGADELFEGFAFGGDDVLSNQDTEAIFDTPPAEWGAGKLTAGFSFEGTGGPIEEFDWVIKDGEIVFLDTVSDSIVGGENGAPEAIENVIGGVVDVRDMIIEEGGLLMIQGVNPLRINATGDVIIRGTLDVSGFNGKDVVSLDTGHQTEPGGVGAAGGGNGGNGNVITSNSSPQGQIGFGPFGEPSAGGMGGESSYAPPNPGNVNTRRPGGGGGGRFAPDLPDDAEFGPDPNAIVLPSTNCGGANQPAGANCAGSNPEAFGLKAQKGFDGHPAALGALSDSAPPKGGDPGAGPFIDGDPSNDFWGTRAILDGLSMETLFIQGELTSLNPGYGGGGGGNASSAPTFPTPNRNIASDEKGGGGGGGGGAVHIKALGRIVFGENGQLMCRGGRGATGENTNFIDHIGGGGGGGSGGHVVLETATRIDFTDSDQFVDFGTNPFLTNTGVPYEGGRLRILASGGDGATIGQNTDGNGATTPPSLGYGGDGGPGIIQLHVPHPTMRPSFFMNPTPMMPNPVQPDIAVPLPVAASPHQDPQDMLRSIMAPGGIPMVGTFGARSRARSDWITLGAADQGEEGSSKQVLFYFDGIDPVTGLVNKTMDGRVAQLEPVLEGLLDDDVSMNVEGDMITFMGAALDPLVNDPGPLSNDLYLRTPTLLQGFNLRLFVEGSMPEIDSPFDVVSAEYDDGTVALTLSVDVGTLGNTMQRFVSDNAGQDIGYELIPRYFRVERDGFSDVIGEDSSVKISFQATSENTFGAPNEDEILVDFTSDISEFNEQPAGAIQFVRYEVEFDLSNGGELTVDTSPVSVDFIRIPFRF